MLPRNRRRVNLIFMFVGFRRLADCLLERTMRTAVRQRLASTRLALALILLAFSTHPLLALDGVNALELSTTINSVPTGWTAFELVTQNDDISAIADADYGNTAARGTYDGLGGYLSGDTLSIFVNHETSGAAISRVDLDLSGFQQAIASAIDGGVTPFPTTIASGMGYAYNSIYDGTYHALNNPNPVASGTAGVAAYGNANFSRFCSGTAHSANSFGAGRGFVDPLYLTGEEVGGGLFYALDSANNQLWEAPDLGLGSWENAALVDTGDTTHVALYLSSDNGTAPGDYVQLYVGEKNVDANGDGGIDFLERNGLRGGTVYFFVPDAGQSTIDLPDAIEGSMTGTWSVSNAGALQETKLEDVHTNPLNGSQLALSDQTDGVYIVDLNLQFSAGAFDPLASTAVFTQIDDVDDAPLSAPDNVTWSVNNLLFLQEDGSGNDMWQMNPDGTGLLQIAHGFSEPSGIYDVSSLVGYQPGSVLLASLQGSGGADAQLSVLISPNAALVPEPATVSLALAAMLFIATCAVILRRQRIRSAVGQ